MKSKNYQGELRDALNGGGGVLKHLSLIRRFRRGFASALYKTYLSNIYHDRNQKYYYLKAEQWLMSPEVISMWDMQVVR